jgi:hypothetical protein
MCCSNVKLVTVLQPSHKCKVSMGAASINTNTNCAEVQDNVQD